MNIFNLRKAVHIHHAMANRKRFLSDPTLEANSTVAMEMFVGLAYKHNIEKDIMIAETFSDKQIIALKESFDKLIKSARYRGKAELIERYLQNNKQIYHMTIT